MTLNSRFSLDRSSAAKWTRRLGAGALAACSLTAVAGLALDMGPDELFEAASFSRQEAVIPPLASVMRAAAGPAASDLPPDAQWAAMTHNLDRLASSYRGRVGIYLKDMQTGREWGYHDGDLFPSASLIKVPILAAVFQKIADGELSLSTEVALRRHDRAGGSGTLKWRRDGTRFAVRELMLRMMRDSDNTATRMLIREAGMGYLQKEFVKEGLVYTQIHPEGMSLTSGRVRDENYTTAREMASLFDKMYKGELVDRFSSELMLDLTNKNLHKKRLAKALPTGWQMSHKTGLLRSACHDVGLITTPKGTFLLAVLTGHNRNYKVAMNFITTVGRAAFGYYEDDFGLVAKAFKASGDEAR